MSTWAVLAGGLVTRHRFATQHDQEVRLVLAIGDAPRTRVGLRVRAASVYGQPAIEITADLGLVAAIDPWAGLRANTVLCHGALAMQGETLVLRAVVPIASLTDDELELRVQLVAAEAAELKRPRLVAPPVTAAFDHYAD